MSIIIISLHLLQHFSDFLLCKKQKVTATLSIRVIIFKRVTHKCRWIRFLPVLLCIKISERVYTSVVQMYTISSGSKLQGLVQQLVEFLGFTFEYSIKFNGQFWNPDSASVWLTQLQPKISNGSKWKWPRIQQGYNEPESFIPFVHLKTEPGHIRFLLLYRF